MSELRVKGVAGGGCVLRGAHLHYNGEGTPDGKTYRVGLYGGEPEGDDCNYDGADPRGCRAYCKGTLPIDTTFKRDSQKMNQ